MSWQIRDGQREYVTETNEDVSELGLMHSSARLLPKGTVILSRTASVGFSAIMGTDMATTQDFVNWVCGPDIRPEYLLYVFRAMEPEFKRLIMGSTHQTIYMPDVSRFETPIAPLEEQDAIVSFIRTETAKIDVLVAKKERLIELLQEKRTALITRAVTQGLDPNVPLRDSGVRLFPRIPREWTAARLRWLMQKVVRPVDVDPGDYYREIGIRSWGRGIFYKEQVLGAHLEDKKVFYVAPGDFVLNIVFAWEGAVAVVSEFEAGMVASHRFPTFRPARRQNRPGLSPPILSERAGPRPDGAAFARRCRPKQDHPAA